MSRALIDRSQVQHVLVMLASMKMAIQYVHIVYHHAKLVWTMGMDNNVSHASLDYSVPLMFQVRLVPVILDTITLVHSLVKSVLVHVPNVLY